MPSVSLNPQRRPPDTGLGEFARSSNAAAWDVAKEELEGRGRDRENEGEDPLLAFHSEHPRGATVRTAIPPPVPTRLPSPSVSPKIIALGLLTFAVGAAGTVSYSRWSAAAPTAAVAPLTSEGRAIINSSPPGALVFINGVARGATPLDLHLPTGSHTLQLQNGASMRTLPLDVQANQVTSHYIELPVVALPPVTRVENPPVARIENPPAQTAARPGRVEAPLQSARTPARGGGSSPASPPVSAQPSQAPRAAAVAEGWALISVPFAAQVTQNGRTIGTTGAAPLALPAGVHTLELANAAFEFHTTLTVAVAPGETTRLSVTLPNGSLSINALPWAEVFVDGRSIGTTPLANVPVPVGSREILWRHPDFGDRRQLVNITARSPVRVGTDLRR